MKLCVYCGFETIETETTYCPKCLGPEGERSYAYRYLRDADKVKLSFAEAQTLTRLLSEHYGEVVRPISVYCRALYQWVGAVERANDPATFVARHEYDKLEHRPGSAYVKHFRDILLSISKSNLLHRLIYGGEKLRTRECPEHKGHWSGLEFFESRCKHGCGLTGWLPEDDDPTFDEQRKLDAMMEKMPCLNEEQAIEAIKTLPGETPLSLDELHAIGLHGFAGIRAIHSTDGTPTQYRPTWMVVYRNAEKPWCWKDFKVKMDGGDPFLGYRLRKE